MQKLTATEARKQWAVAHLFLNSTHDAAKLTTSPTMLAITLEQEARKAEELAGWARKYAELMHKEDEG